MQTTYRLIRERQTSLFLYFSRAYITRVSTLGRLSMRFRSSQLSVGLTTGQ